MDTSRSSERWTKGFGAFCAAYSVFAATLILTGNAAPTVWWTVVGVGLTGVACLGNATRLRRERLRAQRAEESARSWSGERHADGRRAN